MQNTLKLPANVAPRFRPSERFAVWVEGDLVHFERITPPPVTSIVVDTNIRVSVLLRRGMPWRWSCLKEQAAVPDIAVIFPLATFPLPDHQVFAPVEYGAIDASDHVSANLKGHNVVAFHLDGTAFRRLDPHVKGALAESLETASRLV